MRTNIETNKGLVKGVTLPAEDEEGYQNTGDGIELFDPMGDVSQEHPGCHATVMVEMPN